MKKPTKTSLMKKADVLFSKRWREKIGYCQKCGRKETLQTAHIISRDCRKLRYEERNVLCLCYSCHFIFHRKPLEFAVFVDKIKGKGHGKKLILESNDLKPLDASFYEDIIKKYK